MLSGLKVRGADLNRLKTSLAVLLCIAASGLAFGRANLSRADEMFDKFIAQFDETCSKAKGGT
jgi:hypothetical protein